MIKRRASTSNPCIFIAHPSELLTDHLANGDGQVAYGFISGLAGRGYNLHVAVDRISICQPFPPGVTLYSLRPKSANRGLRLLEYATRMRLLFERLRRKYDFQLILQMNPVYPGLSLALVGSGVPIILGTFVPRWQAGAHKFNDGYVGASGLAAKLRDMIVTRQQQHASALLLTTPAAKDRLPAVDKVVERVFFIPHGVDTGVFHDGGKDSLPFNQRSNRLLFVGSVSRRKGIFDLLNALPRVLSECPQARLTVVGPGDDLAEVKSFVSQSPYRERIDLLGPIPRQETAQVYRDHGLYCLPSYGEPYATTLLEAMASGLPVVATAAGGTPFLVPADGGRLVTPGDVEAIATSIIEILSNSANQEQMGIRNRELITSRLAWNTVLDQLETVYYIVTAGKVGRNLSPVIRAVEIVVSPSAHPCEMHG